SPSSNRMRAASYSCFAVPPKDSASGAGSRPGASLSCACTGSAETKRSKTLRSNDRYVRAARGSISLSLRSLEVHLQIARLFRLRNLLGFAPPFFLHDLAPRRSFCARRGRAARDTRLGES